MKLKMETFCLIKKILLLFLDNMVELIILFHCKAQKKMNSTLASPINYLCKLGQIT